MTATNRVSSKRFQNSTMSSSMGLTAFLVMAVVFNGMQTEGATVTPKFVAFSVGKTTHQLGKGRVLYQKHFLNIGNGYDIDRNEFVAPAAGVYHFIVNAMNYRGENGDDRELWLELYKNTEYLVSLYQSKVAYGQASNSIILKLYSGDKLYVRARTANSGLYGAIDEIHCTFTGFLVAPYYKVTTFVG